jgi:hypothetical protein
MCFWVFENTKHYYIKIHAAGCHACTHTKPTHTGRWQGPFESYTQALCWAKNSGRNVDTCKFCHPQQMD